MLKWGMFLAGLFTVSQLSFWGNYLPRVYPTYLRGTGEGFAANVGGRMVGTAANPLTDFIRVTLLAGAAGLSRPAGLAYSAAIVGLAVVAPATPACLWAAEPG